MGIFDRLKVKRLINDLKDEDRFVRRDAAEALGKIGDERAVEPLIRVLKDEEWTVRWEAASALGKIGGVRAEEALIHALRDERWSVYDSQEEEWENKDYVVKTSLKEIKRRESIKSEV